MSYIKQKEARFCHKYIFPEDSNSGSVEWSRPDLAELVYTQSRRRKRAQPRSSEASTTSAGMSWWDLATQTEQMAEASGSRKSQLMALG